MVRGHRPRWEMTAWDTKSGWREAREFTLKHELVKPIKLIKVNSGAGSFWTSTILPGAVYLSDKQHKVLKRNVEREIAHGLVRAVLSLGYSVRDEFS